MTKTPQRETLSFEEARRRAEEWFTNGGSEELARALARADEAAKSFRRDARLDPRVLKKPMTV